MPDFDLYCSSEDLWQRVVPLLDHLPPFFVLTDKEGTPDLRYFANDGTWDGFPFPVAPGVLYLFDGDIPARAIGGALDMQASVRIRPEDPDDVIVCRIWHELLHAVGQPADDMIPFAAVWQTPFDYLLWWVYGWCGWSVDVPYWHKRFYRWLTARAAGTCGQICPEV